MYQGGIIWLSPSYQVFKDDVLVWTPTKNYTAADMVELFIDANANVTASIMQDVEKYKELLDPPGVPTYCIFGYNTSTLYAIGFNQTGNFDYPYDEVRVDGDGTMTTLGLEICSSWVSFEICKKK